MPPSPFSSGAPAIMGSVVSIRPAIIRHLGRTGDLFEVSHNSVGVFFFKFAIVFDELLCVVAELGGYFVPDFAYPGDARIFFLCHGDTPKSSIGVTSIGTYKPSIPLIFRICPNFFAFARCLQFHVNKKSHLKYDANARCIASP